MLEMFKSPWICVAACINFSGKFYFFSFFTFNFVRSSTSSIFNFNNLVILFQILKRLWTRMCANVFELFYPKFPEMRDFIGHFIGQFIGHFFFEFWYRKRGWKILHDKLIYLQFLYPHIVFQHNWNRVSDFFTLIIDCSFFFFFFNMT